MTTTEDRVRQSSTAIANAVELGAQIIHSIAGNDIADTLNGSRVSMDILRSLGQSRIRRNLCDKK